MDKTHLDDFLVVQMWRLFDAKVVRYQCVEPVGRIDHYQVVVFRLQDLLQLRQHRVGELNLLLADLTQRHLLQIKLKQ